MTVRKIAKFALLGVMSVGLTLSFKSLAWAEEGGRCDSDCNDINCSSAMGSGWGCAANGDSLCNCVLL